MFLISLTIMILMFLTALIRTIISKIMIMKTIAVITEIVKLFLIINLHPLKITMVIL